MMWLLYIPGAIIALFLIGSLIEHYNNKTRLYIIPVFAETSNLSRIDTVFKEGLATVIQIKSDKLYVVSHRQFYYENAISSQIRHMRTMLSCELERDGIRHKETTYVFKVRVCYFGNVPEILSCKEIIPFQKNKPKGPPTTENPDKKPRLERVTRPPLQRLR